MSGISERLLVDTACVVTGLLALWQGGPAERRAALIVLANAVFTEASHWMLPQLDSLLRIFNDGTAAAVLLFITLRYGALWTGGVMLFFAAQFGLHSYYLVLERRDGDYIHALVNNLDWTGIILCLLTGTLTAWLDRRRGDRVAEVEFAAP